MKIPIKEENYVGGIFDDISLVLFLAEYLCKWYGQDSKNWVLFYMNALGKLRNRCKNESHIRKGGYFCEKRVE